MLVRLPLNHARHKLRVVDALVSNWIAFRLRLGFFDVSWFFIAFLILFGGLSLLVSWRCTFFIIVVLIF